MIKRKLIARIAGWLVLMIPLVGITNEPLPPPWYEFRFFGLVERTGGGPVQGYPVVLVQDSTYAPYWKVLRSCSEGSPDLPLQDVAFTDETGFFYLHVRLCDVPHDTLAVAVMLPDTIIVGSQVDRRKVHYSEFTWDYSYKEDKSFCQDNTVNVTHVDGYFYSQVDSLVVRIP